MAQSYPNLGRLEPFYGTYKQVTSLTVYTTTTKLKDENNLRLK